MRRPWAIPLVPLYWLGLRTKNALAYRQQPKRLIAPVISIGSLSAGGAGKTPVVMALAGLFERHGITVDVLSRGYGRASGAIEQVDPAGTATRFGDEPLEMALTGLQVFVGGNRFDAGTLAEAIPPNPRKLPHVHLLDDGFQHRQLWRNVNVALLTQADAQDWLLPAGNLREPLTALRRADVVVLRQEEAEALYDQVRTRTRAKVWLVRRILELPAPHPSRLLAFCGIARPEGFFAMLRQNGCELAGTVAFPDHHAYRPEDLDRLASAALDHGADGFVTTAKDAVKLTTPDRSRLERAAPLVVAGLRVVFAAEDEVWQHLSSLLGTASARETSSKAASSP